MLQTRDTALNDKSIAGRERRNYKLKAIGTCTMTDLLLCTIQWIHAILVIYGLQRAWSFEGTNATDEHTREKEHIQLVSQKVWKELR